MNVGEIFSRSPLCHHPRNQIAASTTDRHRFDPGIAPTEIIKELIEWAARVVDRDLSFLVRCFDGVVPLGLPRRFGFTGMSRRQTKPMKRTAQNYAGEKVHKAT